ncbi:MULTISPECIES: metallophosphoesterase [unclassified Pseudomonas]|uniref:metallophosphoesterase n=1 Tax=unclassified Pseudomonas TaxID=196821 RepID=UPI000BDC3D85|nr:MULTISPECIES: metallophosphoesterase [unclassified Pseudomonas]PVZ19982.1 serine/threonine protein phosphatase 1 [Pseudomonas sp. URIL14HWK12:I12]PVZ27048.1 serine/threonine protein phosphatase 1 [Pseudomonas sp. URIL14HWK12:I10]PVZ37937.1 serine/threonine protein phosphatase 1 [Pseudomonas sp. URIL14HWK12:I11]SNZ05071.1 serine/threonine protein phosphatase 1 [Pseudomonas sp. URIL14HWK12:I9]
MARFKHYRFNSRGRDFAVGDIHGHFERLSQSLDRAGFDPRQDRLFSVGDLVDRGPQSDQALAWLDQPWFHAVQGNHEVLTRQFVEQDPQLNVRDYRITGGGWFLDSPPERQRLFAERLGKLPVALEVETRRGLVGLVHANCPFDSWATLRAYLQGRLPPDPAIEDVFQWSRERLKLKNEAGVRDVRAVIVGHTPLRRPRRLGNVWHIDTAGWSEGYFTLVELSTMRFVAA